MRTFTVICCFVLSGANCFAQQAFLDSLQNELKIHTAPDSTRINILTELAFYYQKNNPENGLQAANEAIELSLRANDLKRLSTAYNYKGLNYTSRGNDSVAILYFNKSLAIREQLNDQKGIGSVLHNMAGSYFNLSDYIQSLEYHQKAYEIFKKIGSQKGIATSLNGIGNVYLYLSEYPKALEYYLQSLAVYDKADDKPNIAIAYTNIGLVYHHLSDFKKALEYEQKALSISKESNNLYGIQNILTNIGNLYDDSGSPEKALEYYKQALEINKNLENNRGIASNLVNTGIVYNGMKNYSNAISCLQNALQLYEKLQDKYGMSIALSYLSDAYANAPAATLIEGEIDPAQRYTIAISLQQKALKLSNEIGNLTTESDGWASLSNIYTKQHNISKAFDAYKKHVTLQDSIFNNEKKSAITQMAMQYEFNKKEAATSAEADKKQALALAEIKRQRIVKNAIAFGAAFIIIAVILIFIFYKRNLDADAKHKEAELKAQIAITDMKALRAQMNPHFIFNSLNSISDYMMMHDMETANNYLAKFAKMMRMILENSEHQQISLSDDLKALELYMQLESLRLNGKFTYEIKVDKDIDQDITMVPPLILQPFVENSIWHGIAHQDGKGKILIEIKKEAETINCMVEDNGVGRLNTNEKIENAKRSLGMKITKSRLDLLNISKNSKGVVELKDLAKGMRVEVKLPLALNF